MTDRRTLTPTPGALARLSMALAASAALAVAAGCSNGKAKDASKEDEKPDTAVPV